MKKTIFYIIIVAVIYFLIGAATSYAIPNTNIRIRVIANSDSKYDQNIKTKVKEEIQYDLYNLLKETKGIDEARKIINNNLTNILCVVIRYFGGIKLGAGGLIRAYSNSVRKTIDKVDIISYKKYIEVSIEVNYDNKKLLESIVKDYEVINKDYKDTIVYKIRLEESQKDELLSKIKHTNIRIY